MAGSNHWVIPDECFVVETRLKRFSAVGDKTAGLFVINVVTHCLGFSIKIKFVKENQQHLKDRKPLAFEEDPGSIDEVLLVHGRT